MNRKRLLGFLLVLSFVVITSQQEVWALPGTEPMASQIGISGPALQALGGKAHRKKMDQQTSMVSVSVQSCKWVPQPIPSLLRNQVRNENLSKLSQELVIPILKFAYQDMSPETRQQIKDYLYCRRWTSASGVVQGFSGLEVMEVLGSPSQGMQLLMTYIVHNRQQDYKGLLRESPQLLGQTDARGKTVVHYAIAMLSTSRAAASSTFLNYVFDQLQLRRNFPSAQADDQGDLPIHLIAKQLMILENFQNSLVSPSDYQAALEIAKKIAGLRPNYIAQANRKNYTALEFLRDSRRAQSLIVLLPADFDLHPPIQE
jgi:hypothetical protein